MYWQIVLFKIQIHFFIHRFTNEKDIKRYPRQCARDSISIRMRKVRFTIDEFISSNFFIHSSHPMKMRCQLTGSAKINSDWLVSISTLIITMLTGNGVRYSFELVIHSSLKWYTNRRKESHCFNVIDSLEWQNMGSIVIISHLRT